GPARPCRERAASIYLKKFVAEPSSRGTAYGRVRQRRQSAAPFRQDVDAADHARAPRDAVPLPVFGEKLALEPCDVDADRTFGLARAAFEAQVQSLADVLVAEARAGELPGHGETQCVRAAPRRVLLLERDHIGRAHRAVERFSTGAEPAAHLDGAAHAAVLREIEIGGRVGGLVTGAVPAVRRQRR